MSLLFLFVDGIGLGPEGPKNPFNRISLPAFEKIARGHRLTSEAPAVDRERWLFRGVDANLKVEGLPQSGTGQTSLFTGINAAQKIGKHFGPYPHSGIKPLLRKESLFLKASALGKRVHFINAYPDIFFKKSRKRNRWSCTTLMCRSAGITLNGEEEVREGRAVTAGLTQKAWREKLGIDVPVISPEKAAGRVMESLRRYDLVLHEYYLTDKAGHNRNEEEVREVLRRYDRFLGTIMEELREGDTLVLCSDHGNLENLSVKTHTRNPVPLFVAGRGTGAFRGAESILDVTPAILEVMRDS